MPKFLPGQSGNLKGKPKGTKDLRQFSLSFWFNIILENYAALNPHQRSQIGLECWKKLIDKAKSLPSDPEASAFNADEAMKTLRDLEQKVKVVTPASPPVEPA